MNWGGQEYRTINESIGLNKNGYTSWIMCHPQSQIYLKSRELGANELPMNLNRPYRIDVMIRILIFCVLNKVDVINAHGSRDALLVLPAKLLGIRVLRSRHISKQIKKGTSYKFFSHIIVTAEKIKNMLIDKGIPPRKISVVGTGVDHRIFTPDLSSDYLRREFSVPDTYKVIVNVGMIRGDKGQLYYLDAAKILLEKHKNVIFFLIGEPTNNSRVKEEIQSRIDTYALNNSFIMTGYRKDVNAFINMANLVVVASTGVEGQPQVIGQAFAAKRTVVATNVGGIPDLVKHGQNGLLVEPRNPHAIAEAVNTLLSEPSLREQLENEAYIFSKMHLSFESMMEKLLKIYTKQ